MTQSDYTTFQRALEQQARKYQVEVHAYVLMPNHAHLLVTPLVAGGASRFMQQLGRRYVRYFNDAHGRTGTLWEGRFRSSPVASDRYLLACYRYIEENPVRAGIVSAPAAYRWTSFHCNAFGIPDPLVTPHSTYLALGSNDEERHSVYRRLFCLDADFEFENLRIAVRKGRPL